MGVPKTEEAAVRRIIKGILADGWHLDQVYDGEENYHVSTTAEAMVRVFDVDMAHVYFQHPDTDRIAWVWFVLGNSPEEVAADYTISLESSINRVTEDWHEEWATHA